MSSRSLEGSVMRRTIRLILACLELAAAGVLVLINFYLPSGADVHAGFDRAERVTGEASVQLRLFQAEVATIRGPRLREAVLQINAQLPKLRSRIDTRDLTLDAGREVSQSLTQLAQSLDAWAAVFDPGNGKKLTLGVGQMADEMSRLSEQFNKLLGVGDSLKNAADGLREVRKGLDGSTKNWPALQQSLRSSAVNLRAVKTRLDEALSEHSTYRQTLVRVIDLTDTLAQTIPLLTEHLDLRLENQEKSLGRLSVSLGEVNQSLPAAGDTLAKVMLMIHWLLYIVAAGVAVHATYLFWALYGR